MSLANTFAAWGVASSLAAQVSAILRKYGTDAHVYLPGIGVINGLTAGNYLDSAGTTAATVDNPVGLVLDAANSVIGAEKTVNGDFSDGTTTGAGVAGTGYSSTLSNVSNKLRVTKTQAIGMAVIGTTGTPLYIPTTVGSTYKMTVSTGDKTGAGGFDIRIGTAPESASYYRNNTITANQSVTFYVVATTATMSISLMSAGGASGDYNEWDNISVKEVTGILATQATTANKPILRQSGSLYYLQYDGINDNLALESPPFQTQDLSYISVGARVTANAFACLCASRKSGVNIPVAGLIAWDNAASKFRCNWRDDAAVNIFVTSTNTFAFNSTYVVSARRTATLLDLRVNGVLEGSLSTAGLGVSTCNLSFLGANHDGTSNVNYLTGFMYPAIMIKGAVSDAERLIIDRFVGQLSGVTI